MTSPRRSDGSTPTASEPRDGTFAAPAGIRRVDVTGDDRARYLEDVTTQRITELAVGDVVGALHLDPNGAPQAMFDVVALGDRLVLLAPDPDVQTVLTDVLGARTFLLDATFTATSDEAVAVRGPDADAALTSIGLGRAPGRCRLVEDVLVVDRGEGADVLAEPGTLAEIVDSLGAAGVGPGGALDLERWRIRAGQPAWGREVVAATLPEEAGVLPTHVHLAKGCYPGQEAVARMWILGRPRRRVAQATVSGPVSEGWEHGEGRDRVRVTSVDPERETALAVVPADASAGVRYGDDTNGWIEVLQIVGDDPAPPGHDPAVTRRRDRPRS